MSWIILKQPHVLDTIWSMASDAVDKTQSAIDDLVAPYTNEEMDALVNANVAAILAVMALPARNIDDALYKLTISGPLDCGPMDGIDREAILNEALETVDAGRCRGRKLINANPNLLEGITL